MELIDRLKRLNRKDFQRIVFSFVAEFSTAINQFSNDERGIENCLFDDCICGVIIFLKCSAVLYLIIRFLRLRKSCFHGKLSKIIITPQELLQFYIV